MTAMMKVPVTANGLIEKERDLIHLVSLGKTDHEIGIIIGRSPNTVAQRIRVACQVADVVNRTQLACKALREGWIQ